jgi:hypothetical protein
VESCTVVRNTSGIVRDLEYRHDRVFRAQSSDWLVFDPESPFKLNDPIEPYIDSYSYESDSDLDHEEEQLMDTSAELVIGDPNSAESPIPPAITRHLAVRDIAYKTCARI